MKRNISSPQKSYPLSGKVSSKGGNMENIKLNDIIELAKNKEKISISFIQRNFSVGFVKASHYYMDLINAGLIEKRRQNYQKNKQKWLKNHFFRY